MGSLAVNGSPKSVLAQVKTLKDAKDLSAQAEAMRRYAKQAGMKLEDQNKAAEAKLWIERAGGELLVDMRQSGRRAKHRPKNGNGKLPILSDLGISKMQASRWQRLALIPLAAFESYIFATIGAHDELTTAAALGLAREIVNTQKKRRAAAKGTPRVLSEGEAEEAGETNPAVFDLILADPPWQYDFSETQSRDVENQYPTAGVEDIEAHCTADWFPAIADSAVLFLWATAPKLREAMSVMDAWGFEYKTNAVWDKEKIGMGYWFRGQHELLLVGTRGVYAPPEQKRRVSSVFREARGRHSAKPSCVYEAIESMFPDATKCELYQRNPREGWVGVSNELEAACA